MGVIKMLKPEYEYAYRERFGDATWVNASTPDEWWTDIPEPQCPSCAALRARLTLAEKVVEAARAYRNSTEKWDDSIEEYDGDGRLYSQVCTDMAALDAALSAYGKEER